MLLALAHHIWGEIQDELGTIDELRATLEVQLLVGPHVCAVLTDLRRAWRRLEGLAFVAGSGVRDDASTYVRLPTLVLFLDVRKTSSLVDDDFASHLEMVSNKNLGTCNTVYISWLAYLFLGHLEPLMGITASAVQPVCTSDGVEI
jgi:hypothetical protein